MKNRYLLFVFCLFTAISLSAQSFTGILKEAKELKDGGSYLEASKKYCEARSGNLKGKQLLDVLFPEAECYYMLDDYQQLDSVIVNYIKCFRESPEELGDSLDVYKAYLFKMLGNALYAEVDMSSTGIKYAESANEYYMNSLKIFGSHGSEYNAYVLLKELAQLFYKVKAYSYAYDYLNEVKSRYQERLDNGIFDEEPDYYNTLSLMALCKARMAASEKNDNNSREQFNSSIAQIDSAIVYGQKKKDRLFSNWMRIKGKILMMQYDRLNINNKRTAKACYEQYVNYQRNTVGGRLAQMTESQQEQNWLALHDFLYDCYRLGEEAPEMLYDLALFSKNYLLDKRQTDKVRWQDVRKVLKAEDCALEFVQYRGANDESHLACLVLKNSSERPQFIEIAATNDILKRELNEQYNLDVEQCMTYQRGEFQLASIKNLLYSDSVLFHQIWTPQLMKAIGDAKKVYFAPDGFLHQLAIEYMIPDTLKDCYRLSSTRVLTKKKEPVNYSKLLVCGGMNYHAKINPHTSGNDVRAYNFFAGKGSVNELPSTIKEIQTIMDVRKNPADTLLTGDKATDENFMQLLSRHYPIVHISTHGYFAGSMDSGTDLKPSTSDFSMSKSGLIFSGASSALTDKDFNTNMFDGVLSASEVAKFDMRGTDLVALSACQTALGDITADGVFGMQRALKMAGAKGLMVSLWSVGDLSSYKLFSYFYEELEKQQEKDIHKAWMVARKKLSEYVHITPYFNMKTLEEDVHVTKFDQPNDTFPYVLIDIY